MKAKPTFQSTPETRPQDTKIGTFLSKSSQITRTRSFQSKGEEGFFYLHVEKVARRRRRALVPVVAAAKFWEGWTGEDASALDWMEAADSFSSWLLLLLLLLEKRPVPSGRRRKR